MTPDQSAQIDDFLAERRESHGGGWAQITREDVIALGDIIKMLIEAKCEPDADGDYPIDVHLVNRRENEPLHYEPLPYAFEPKPRTHEGTITRLEKRLRIAIMNLGIATSAVKSAYNALELEKCG